MNFKDIHIGTLINHAVTDSGIEISRICNFFKCTPADVYVMFESKTIDTEILLKWSKLLEYDFFRIYTQHMILYAPPSADNPATNSGLPKFRKNIYTKEIIEFILEQLESGEMTRKQVIERYRIPKTTLYKWISKYKDLVDTGI